jgi:hypothetical protein
MILIENVDGDDRAKALGREQGRIIAKAQILTKP